MVLLIDNYDSFVHNLARYVEELGREPVVYRNDALTPEEVERMGPSHVILSPGPRTPADAGICVAIVRRLGHRVPILGVCLGHQCIGAAFGGEVPPSGRPVHGEASLVFHEGAGLFSGLPSPFAAARYHSLVVRREGLPPDLAVTAWTEDGTIMGLEHREHPTFGVQFHPESILTEHGHALLENFLSLEPPRGGEER